MGTISKIVIWEIMRHFYNALWISFFLSFGTVKMNASNIGHVPKYQQHVGYIKNWFLLQT